eukprot:scaffold4372_cov397-Prasinococcus_capsulatus_cf.AAC.48
MSGFTISLLLTLATRTQPIGPSQGMSEMEVRKNLSLVVEAFGEQGANAPVYHSGRQHFPVFGRSLPLRVRVRDTADCKRPLAVVNLQG